MTPETPPQPPAGFDVRFALQEMYPLVAAAYDMYEHFKDPQQPDYTLPPGYSLVQSIIASGGPDAGKPFGLIIKNDQTRTLVIAIRGTEDESEWDEDFHDRLVPYGYASGAGNVSEGFQEAYQFLTGSIYQGLANPAAAGLTTFYITGHSLGGALDVLCALDVVANKRFPVAPVLYTMAGPRAGDPEFANAFNRAIAQCYRIVNVWDLVPKVPLEKFGYLHVGAQCPIDGGFALAAEAHILTDGYLKGLQKAAGLAQAAQA